MYSISLIRQGLWTVTILFLFGMIHQAVLGQTTFAPGPYGVHDPVMIRQDSTYYVFSTGMGISCCSSVDLMHWNKQAPVFKEPLRWAVKAVAGYKGHTWAPD